LQLCFAIVIVVVVATVVIAIVIVVIAIAVIAIAIAIAVAVAIAIVIIVIVFLNNRQKIGPGIRLRVEGSLDHDGFHGTKEGRVFRAGGGRFDHCRIVEAYGRY